IPQLQAPAVAAYGKDLERGIVGDRGGLVVHAAIQVDEALGESGMDARRARLLPPRARRHHRQRDGDCREDGPGARVHASYLLETGATAGDAASRSRTAPSSERSPQPRPVAMASSTGTPSIHAARSAAIAPTRLPLAQCTSTGACAAASKRSKASTLARVSASGPAMGRLS